MLKSVKLFHTILKSNPALAKLGWPYAKSDAYSSGQPFTGRYPCRKKIANLLRTRYDNSLFRQ
jgi:hypothetical protein